MSTMYYTVTDRKPVAQVHNLGRDKGYHVTWAMTPDEYAEYILKYVFDNYFQINYAFIASCIVNEYGVRYSYGEFRGIITQAKSHSYDERIE